MNSDTPPQDSDAIARSLNNAERYDYERLKALEDRGNEEYQKLSKAPTLTTERVLAFINQLSPWNLKTTGVSVLEAYVQEQNKVVNRTIQHSMDSDSRNAYNEDWRRPKQALQALKSRWEVEARIDELAQPHQWLQKPKDYDDMTTVDQTLWAVMTLGKLGSWFDARVVALQNQLPSKVKGEI